MGKPYKIALFIPTLGKGGAERVFVNLANGLAKKGYQVTILLVKNIVESQYQLDHSITIECFEKKKISGAFFTLIKYLKNKRPDFLLSGLESANFFACLANFIASTNTKLIVTVHNDLVSMYKNTRNWKQLISLKYANKIYWLADQVVTVSEGVKASLARISPVLKGKLTRIYNPIMDAKIIEYSHSITNPIKIEDGKKLIVAAGRLTHQKNFGLLIEAINLLKVKEKVQVLILGEGEDRTKLQTQIDNLGLNSIVNLVGYTDNPYYYYKRANIFVLSSIFEGFGNVLIEAMAFGCQIISTDCPSGPSEILENGKYGTLLKTFDAKELAEVIHSNLVKEKFAPEELKKRAFEFSIENAVNQYDSLLKTLN